MHNKYKILEEENRKLMIKNQELSEMLDETQLAYVEASGRACKMENGFKEMRAVLDAVTSGRFSKSHLDETKALYQKSQESYEELQSFIERHNDGYGGLNALDISDECYDKYVPLLSEMKKAIRYDVGVNLDESEKRLLNGIDKYKAHLEDYFHDRVCGTEEGLYSSVDLQPPNHKPKKKRVR